MTQLGLTKLARRRLEWLIRARGTDLSLWPERDRVAALAMMRRSPDLRQAFVDALVTEEAPEDDAPMQDRMQAALRRRLAPLSGVLRGLLAGALVACVAAGLYLGATVDREVAQDQPTDVFASAQSVSFAALDQ